MRVFIAGLVLLIFSTFALADDERRGLPVEIITLPDPIVDQEQVRRSVRDLEAQESMARWTKGTFFVATASTVLSAVALLGLFLSLRHTRTSLKDNRTLGELQTQAYVQAIGCSFGIGNSIIVECKNFGQSPAPFFALNACAQRVRFGNVQTSIKQRADGFKMWSAMGPDQILKVNVDVDDSDVIRSFIQSEYDKDEVLLISGTILCGTVFNHDHRTDFAFYARTRQDKIFRRPTNNVKSFWRIPIEESKEWRKQFPSPWDRA